MTPLNLPSEQSPSPPTAFPAASDISTYFPSSPLTLTTVLPEKSPPIACPHPPASPSWPKSPPNSFTAHISSASSTTDSTCPLPTAATVNPLLKAQQKGKLLLSIAVISTCLIPLSHPPVALKLQAHGTDYLRMHCVSSVT